MADGIRATPYRSSFAGSANDILGGLLGYMRDPRRTQQMQGLAGLLESTGIPKTVERLAYGEPLTNLQKANVPTLRPETAEALMTLLPVPSGASRAAKAVDPVVQKYGPKLEQSLLPAFEAAYNRGGLTREMVEAMGTGARSNVLPAGLLQDFSQGSAARAIPETSLLAQSKAALPTDYYQLNTMATQAYSDLRANPSQETSDYYKAIMKARDEASNNPSKSYAPPVADVVPESYKGQHTAPTKDSGAPLWNLKDTYPDDFYSYQGAKFYGDGADEARDRVIVSQMQAMKGRPDKQVTIYRAVPKSVPTKEALNTGDWITLDRQYAKEHGEGALGGDYKIIKKTVKARDLFTNGDSIYEMGYDPQPFKPKRDLGLLD